MQRPERWDQRPDPDLRLLLLGAGLKFPVQARLRLLCGLQLSEDPGASHGRRPHLHVRATDPAGNTDPTPAVRSFTVQTAEVKVSGSTLVVTAAAGAKDNLRISRPSASTLRVTDFPSGAYTGSGVRTGAGCTRSGDYSANCSASGITLVRVLSADQIDRVVNSTAVKSSLNGGAANDVLTGGSADDTLTG